MNRPSTEHCPRAPDVKRGSWSWCSMYKTCAGHSCMDRSATGSGCTDGRGNKRACPSFPWQFAELHRGSWPDQRSATRALTVGTSEGITATKRWQTAHDTAPLRTTYLTSSALVMPAVSSPTSGSREPLDSRTESGSGAEAAVAGCGVGENTPQPGNYSARVFPLTISWGLALFQQRLPRKPEGSPTRPAHRKGEHQRLVQLLSRSSRQHRKDKWHIHGACLTSQFAVT